MMKKSKKKQAKSDGKKIVRILIPEKLERINENSGWCRTVIINPNAGSPKKPSGSLFD